MKNLLLSTLCGAVLSIGFANGCIKKSPDSETTSTAQTNVNSKRITFIVGPISRSITVAQVEEFVSKNNSNDDVSALLKAGNLNAAEVRSQLGKVYELELVQMDKILNSAIGVALLTRLGEAIHPHNNKAMAVQAIRSAIVLSLANDNKLSPLEVLQHLPVDLDIEVLALLKLKDELGGAFAPAIL